MTAPHVNLLARCRWPTDTQSGQPATPAPTCDGKENGANTWRRYDRARDLPKLIGLWPWELGDQTLAGHEQLLKLLRRALRRERQRGLAGHWTYDLARHTALLKAYQSEAADFRTRLGRRTPPCRRS